jgi:formamidopyrimidine-DNA glycosylase
MPELPEVESVRRLMERVLAGRKLIEVEVPEDTIVLSGFKPGQIRETLLGRTVKKVGRRGKTWWLELDQKPWLYGHLGMTGWIREIGGKETRLMEHGKAPINDEEGRPRFLKLLLRNEKGGIAFTDARRLGRLWLVDDPSKDKRLKQVGPDAMLEMPDAKGFQKLLTKRNTSIKAVLMDQATLSGMGNWIADEVLYQARIKPAKIASKLTAKESALLREKILEVLELSIKVEADYEKYPDSWLFKHRWGGKRGKAEIGGHKIVRETIAGRTTAWVPAVQK